MEVVRQARRRADTAVMRGVLQGVVVFRWLALGYASVGLIVSDEHWEHPGVAALLLGAAAVFTAWTTWAYRHRLRMLTHPTTIAIEFALGVVLLIADGWVYHGARPQSLPWAWPAASLITAAVGFGARIGITLALAMGVASFIGEGLTSGGARWGTAASSKTALYVLAAAVAGYLARRLREAEQRVSVATARAEIARTLHDGVLQTLAVVQRRSDDPDLVALAREQDSELRRFLFGADDDAPELVHALHEIGARMERRHGVVTQVIVPDDLPPVSEQAGTALVGAVTEALNNVAKHAGATRVFVYLEPSEDRGIVCSVKDDGCGFDVASTHEGQGLRRSVRERIEQVSGTVEIRSRPGRGTEVLLWVR